MPSPRWVAVLSLFCLFVVSVTLGLHAVDGLFYVWSAEWRLQHLVGDADVSGYALGLHYFHFHRVDWLEWLMRYADHLVNRTLGAVDVPVLEGRGHVRTVLASSDRQVIRDYRGVFVSPRGSGAKLKALLQGKRPHNQSLTINFIDLKFKPQIARDLHDATGRRPCDVHLYVSQPGAASYGWHTDWVDKLIVCVRGQKHFQIGGRKAGAPVVYDAVMNPGDALYIPAGVMHNGFSSGMELSILLSIGLYRSGFHGCDVFSAHKLASYAHKPTRLKAPIEAPSGLSPEAIALYTDIAAWDHFNKSIDGTQYFSHTAPPDASQAACDILLLEGLAVLVGSLFLMQVLAVYGQDTSPAVKATNKED